jgi:hypothetical protein
MGERAIAKVYHRLQQTLQHRETEEQREWRMSLRFGAVQNLWSTSDIVQPISILYSLSLRFSVLKKAFWVASGE